MQTMQLLYLKNASNEPQQKDRPGFMTYDVTSQ